MKIAFVFNQFPTISETFILSQIIGLIQRGHQIDIYAGTPKNYEIRHTDIENYQLLNHTYLWQYMPEEYLPRSLKGLKLLLGSFYKKPILLLQSLNFLNYGIYAFSLRSLYAVIAFSKYKRQYDIIHCHFGLNGLLGVFLRNSGILTGKLITSFYGYDISGYPKKFGDKVYSPLFQSGDAFWVISEQMQKQVLNLGADSEKVDIHRLGINCNRFSFKSRPLHNSNRAKLISIARLVEKKGIEYSIRAFAKTAQENQFIKYNIIGDGILRENLEKLIQELNLKDRVEILGWKNQSEVTQLLSESDILLAPSVTAKDGDEEGTPVVIMEAMAMGLPVISTWHSGIPEMIKDGVSGFLVPERNVEELAKKINYLIQHPEIWEKMGRAGRKQIEQHHDINELNNNLVKKYEQLLQRG